MRSPGCTTSFNPRARTGATIAPPSRDGFPMCFNPRARTGATRGHWPTRHRRRSFNPRARTGRDHGYLQLRLLQAVSIHAPARGATLDVARSIVGRRCFNPRARTGRDGVLIEQFHRYEKARLPRTRRHCHAAESAFSQSLAHPLLKTTACAAANLKGRRRSLGVRAEAQKTRGRRGPARALRRCVRPCCASVGPGSRT